MLTVFYKLQQQNAKCNLCRLEEENLVPTFSRCFQQERVLIDDELGVALGNNNIIEKSKWCLLPTIESCSRQRRDEQSRTV